MNLTKNLIDVYDKKSKEPFYWKCDEAGVRLIPVGFSTAESDIEVVIDESSNFISAKIIDKKERNTLIPVSEGSEVRTSATAPSHKLFDKLSYLIPESLIYFNKPSECFEKFLLQLKDTVDEYNEPLITIFYNYIQKGSLLSDLLSTDVLDDYKNDDNVLSFNKNDPFIRFVILKDDEYINFNETESVVNIFLQEYLKENSNGEDIDYNTGNKGKAGTKFPNKIRTTADKAKLFSSNDDSCFTFRGQLRTPEEAVCINKIEADKMHNALKYLIKKQGKFINGKEFLIFGNLEKDIDLLDNDVFILVDDEIEKYDTLPEYTKYIGDKIFGFKSLITIDEKSFITVIILDSLSQGRLSLNFFKEYIGLQINDFLKNVEKWYSSTTYYYLSYNKKEKKWVNGYNSCSIIDVAKCAYGLETEKFIETKNKKVHDKCISELLRNVLSNTQINLSLLQALNNRAKNPKKYKNWFNWLKTLSVACAMNRRYFNKKLRREEIPLSNDNKPFELNFELGRLLAVYELFEKSCGVKHKNTIAERYFSQYMAHPMRTYEIIHKSTLSYEAKLKNTKPGMYYKLSKIREEIITNIDPETFKNAKNLDGRALCGYFSQTVEFYKKNKDDLEEESEE